MAPMITPTKKMISIIPAKRLPGSGMLDVEEVQELLPQRSLLVAGLVPDVKKEVVVKELAVFKLLKFQLQLAPLRLVRLLVQKVTMVLDLNVRVRDLTERRRYH